MSEQVTVEIRDGILTLGMNRPEKKNALTREMYAALAEELERSVENREVRVVLITGTADCFTSGNDLKDFLANPQTDESSPVVRFLHRISTFPKPIVAAVSGLAIGIGTTLLLHCDLIYAGEDARFQMPFVNLGLCPEGASSLLVPRLAGYHRAAELLMLGEMFSAAQAREIGLVNRVVPNGDVPAVAREAAAKLAALPPGAMAVTKSLLKKGSTEETRRVMDEELDRFGERLQSPEAKEAVTAFFERRKPDFSKFG